MNIDCELSALIIDDNIVDSELIKSIFKNTCSKTKFDIDYAYTGVDGLNLIRSKKYDFIMLDQFLPDLSGVDVLSKVSDENIVLTSPIFAMSGTIGSSTDLDLQKILDHQYVVSYLDKTSITYKRMIAMIIRMIVEHKLQFKYISIFDYLRDNCSILNTMTTFEIKSKHIGSIKEIQANIEKLGDNINVYAGNKCC